MAAYVEPRSDPAEGFTQGLSAMSQKMFDDARRQEIAQRAAAQYGGMQNQGQQNTIAFAQSPVGGPDAGYKTEDQGATQRFGQQMQPPPIEAAPAQNRMAAQAGPPPLPPGLDTTALAPPPAGTPPAPPRLEQPPAEAGAPPLPPPAAEMPPPPPTLDEGKLDQFRNGVRQAMATYDPLTRQKLRAQGLTDPEIDELRGIGPVSDQTKQRILQLGSAQLPQYSTGTETPDYKMNAQLQQEQSQYGVQGLRNQGLMARNWHQARDETRQQLVSNLNNAQNPMNGILNPAMVSDAQNKLNIYDQAEAGTLKQIPDDPELQALAVKGAGFAAFARQRTGQDMSGGGAPAPAKKLGGGTGVTLDSVLARLPGDVRAKVEAARAKGIPDATILNSADVQAYVNKPKLRK